MTTHHRHAFSLFALCIVAVTGRCFSTELPFRFEDGFIQVEARVAGAARPLNLLVDSGASISVLNLKTVRRLGLETKDPLRVQGVSAATQAWRMHSLAATFGGMAPVQFTTAADMSKADELCSEPIDGLIGVDFFRDRIIQIDYARHCLRILQSSPTPVSQSTSLPVRILNDVACVPIGVNGSRPRWTRLDTGCNDSLHWVVSRPGPRAKERAVSVGFLSNSKDLTLAKLSLARLTLYSVPTAFHGETLFDGEAGLLGNGVLSQFSVTLDWPGRTLTLAAPSNR